MITAEHESMSKGRIRSEGRYLRPHNRSECLRSKRSSNDSKAKKAAHVARRKARQQS